MNPPYLNNLYTLNQFTRTSPSHYSQTPSLNINKYSNIIQPIHPPNNPPNTYTTNTHSIYYPQIKDQNTSKNKLTVQTKIKRQEMNKLNNQSYLSNNMGIKSQNISRNSSPLNVRVPQITIQYQRPQILNHYNSQKIFKYNNVQTSRETTTRASQFIIEQNTPNLTYYPNILQNQILPPKPKILSKVSKDKSPKHSSIQLHNYPRQSTNISKPTTNSNITTTSNLPKQQIRTQQTNQPTDSEYQVKINYNSKSQQLLAKEIQNRINHKNQHVEVVSSIKTVQVKPTKKKNQQSENIHTSNSLEFQKQNITSFSKILANGKKKQQQKHKKTVKEIEQQIAEKLIKDLNLHFNYYELSSDAFDNSVCTNKK